MLNSSTTTISAVILGFMTVSASAEKLTVTGCASVAPIVEKAAEVFQSRHETVSIHVGDCAAEGGITAVREGKVNIGMASRPINQIANTTSDLIATTVALEGLALIVHPSNPLKNLTTEQVQKVFNGTIINWSELGGQDATIELIAMDKSNPSHTFFLESFKLTSMQQGTNTQFSTADQDWAPGPMATVSESSDKTIATVNKNVAAIGYLSIATLESLESEESDPMVKPLNINNVQANKINVNNGTYPIARQLQVLTNGTPTGVLEQFIEFLKSDQATIIVKGMDYFPATQMTANVQE